MTTTLDTLRRFIEHAPRDPGPMSTELAGWQSPELYLCATCAGRIMARGCRLPDGFDPVWDDQPHAGECCLCGGSHQ